MVNYNFYIFILFSIVYVCVIILFSFSPLETVVENVIRLTNAQITEVPFEDFCPVKDKVQYYVQCDSCKVS